MINMMLIIPETSWRKYYKKVTNASTRFGGVQFEKSKNA